jgi:hypothetical protein
MKRITLTNIEFRYRASSLIILGIVVTGLATLVVFEMCGQYRAGTCSVRSVNGELHKEFRNVLRSVLKNILIYGHSINVYMPALHKMSCGDNNIGCPKNPLRSQYGRHFINFANVREWLSSLYFQISNQYASVDIGSLRRGSPAIFPRDTNTYSGHLIGKGIVDAGKVSLFQEYESSLYRFHILPANFIGRGNITDRFKGDDNIYSRKTYVSGSEDRHDPFAVAKPRDRLCLGIVMFFVGCTFFVSCGHLCSVRNSRVIDIVTLASVGWLVTAFALGMILSAY